MTGTLTLEFSLREGRTALKVTRQEPPWRALRAFSNPSGEALVHLHNVSGGVLGGDELRLEVSLGAEAQAQITTVGATRVHRHQTGKPDANQKTVLRIGAGAMLEYLPDPVIPFACSRFAQACEIHLADGAGLIWWETVAAGRIAHGESFSFENYAVATSIRCGNTPVALERYMLTPDKRPLTSAARMGPFQYSVTMYVCRADASSRWLGLENELNEMAQELSGPETRWGASCLAADGMILRGLACHAHQASYGLRNLWQKVKQAVWQRDALLPRKIH